MNEQEFFALKRQTLDSFEKLDEHLYLMNFTVPYGMDAILRDGVSNTLELARFVQREMRSPKNVFTLAGGGFACTTFNVYKPTGEHLLARNFDYKDGPSLIYWTDTGDGYKSVAFTAMNCMLYGYVYQKPEESPRERTLLAPYICMDGINEKGLTIAVLEVKTKATKQSTGKKPLVTTVMIRAVLDKCATVEEALELMKSYDMHDLLFVNYHYQICDKSGKSVIVEYVNNEMRIIYPEDKHQYLMNFFLSEDGDNKKGFGYERRDEVEATLEKTGGIMQENEAIDTLERCLLNYKHKRGYMITTLWSAVYNCEECSVTFTGGMDYSRVYKLWVNEPGKVERIK